MSQNFQITAGWEVLNEGPPEERSCFAALGIHANGSWVTEGVDELANRLRQAPLLSAYHLAEWFAWNWWRLRWEPRASSDGWNMAHRMSSIGHGYIWPDMTIFSDGKRTALISKASRDVIGAPFRYIKNAAAIIPSLDFEAEIDHFVGQVLERLESASIHQSNLQVLWGELAAERSDSEVSRVRKVEALLGLQPDQLDDALLHELISREGEFGPGAIDELAADHGNGSGRPVVRPSELVEEGRRSGYSSRPNDSVRLADLTAFRGCSDTPAWRVGADMANALREQEGLGDGLLKNQALAQFVGVDQAVIKGSRTAASGVSYMVSEQGGQRDGRILLRSKWEEGRRFELARLLGDILAGHEGTLHPATHAYTYRQKMQRSFAAELLSPFNAVRNMLQGDYSPEAQSDVARHFNVSVLTIRTQLLNHHILERDVLDGESDLWRTAA